MIEWIYNFRVTTYNNLANQKLAICKNCGDTLSANYCGNCGQSAATHQLDAHFLWHDLQHGFFHFDKGILFTIKELFTRPGHAIREFIEGKRVKFFKPVSLTILLATLYGLLYHFFHINMIATNNGKNLASVQLHQLDINDWIATHYAWITLMTIPLYTLGTTIAFRKQGYNFIEYFILNTFKASQRLFFHIGTFPVLYYFNGTSQIRIVTTVFFMFDLVLVFWTNIQFFHNLKPMKAFLLSLLSYAIFLIVFFIILIGVIIVLEIK